MISKYIKKDNIVKQITKTQSTKIWNFVTEHWLYLISWKLGEKLYADL